MCFQYIRLIVTKTRDGDIKNFATYQNLMAWQLIKVTEKNQVFKTYFMIP